jgi:hypothetical protein
MTERPLAESFEAKGYVVLNSIIDRATADFLADYVARYIASGLAKPDGVVPGTPAAYAAPLMEKTMHKLVPAVETASGRLVYPTYSYFRSYKEGDKLIRHRDRPACEISLSICLDFRGPAAWPLFIEGPPGVVAIELQKGDGVLYKGTECFHWRDPFAGASAAQVFFHYVDRNGPYAEWRLDKRKE